MGSKVCPLGLTILRNFHKTIHFSFSRLESGILRKMNRGVLGGDVCDEKHDYNNNVYFVRMR